jgi:transposase
VNQDETRNQRMNAPASEKRMERKIVELLKSGKSQNEIVKILGVGDRRVRRVKKMAETWGYIGTESPIPIPPFPEDIFPDAAPSVPPDKPVSEPDLILRSKMDWIKERLISGWHPITVYEELNESVSRSSFYRFLSRHDLDHLGEKERDARVVPEIVHSPGEALLLDWGKLRDVVDPATGKKRPLWAFVGILGYSRYMMVRLVWSNDVTTTMSAIQDMLREIGGTPARITSDNPKCFALEASRYEPLLNPVFERLGSHFNCIIECLPPRDPQKKGKVERPMSFVRRLYEAHGDQWLGIDESQAYMDKKVDIANQRIHGTTRLKPIEQLLNVEANALKSLPPLGYTPEIFSEARVRSDGHVRFDNKYYSLHERFVGEKVIIIGTIDRVSIHHQGKLIETHQRLQDPLRTKSTKIEHLKPWEQAMQDDSIYRK